MSAISYAFVNAHYSLIPILIFAFIAAHALGQGRGLFLIYTEPYANPNLPRNTLRPRPTRQDDRVLDPDTLIGREASDCYTRR